MTEQELINKAEDIMETTDAMEIFAVSAIESLGIPFNVLAGLAAGDLTVAPRYELERLLARAKGFPVKHQQQAEDIRQIEKSMESKND